MIFAAEHLEPANVIAMLVRQEHTIELLRRHAAKREPHYELTRTQPAIDQQPAMIGHEQRAVSGAPTAERREAEHV